MKIILIPKSLNLAVLLLVILFGYSCHQRKEQSAIKDYAILVSKDADSLTQRAANELQQYIFEVTSVRPPIFHKAQNDQPYFFVGKSWIDDKEQKAVLQALKDDDFLIQSNEKGVFLAGENGKTNLYAVYTFIEDYLGCRLLTPTVEHIPQNKDWRVPVLDSVYHPTFTFRRPRFPGAWDEKFRYWHKIETLDDWGLFVHTFNQLIPPEEYFDEHPEYFSLVGGKRLQDGQLSLSNPEVIELLKTNLGKKIKENPKAQYWSVSQNDCFNYCESPGDKALYEKYESVSGAYIQMVNEIAKKFPDKTISTLAYQFSRQAPKNIIPEPNVNIMFCSIECNRSMPLEEDPRSEGFVIDMEDWAQLTNNIFAWDYVVQFKNFLTPFPNFHTLQPNIQFFAKYKVPMMFQQGSGKTYSDFSELKQYLIAKLLWNKDADVEALTQEFMHLYYGAAADKLLEYHRRVHEEMIKNKDTEFLNIYGFPTDYVDSFLQHKLLEEYKSLFDEAEKSVKEQPEYLERLHRARTALDFAYLDIALHKPNGSVSFVEEHGSTKHIKKNMLTYLDEFVERSEKTGANIINERDFTTAEYKTYTLKKLDLMVKTNLAKEAKIKSLTKFSDTYPVGGAKALLDGKFGPLDFHSNWLGYQGNDMEVDLDLQKPIGIQRVNINFLKAINSWVFLPTEIQVQVSTDGSNYKTVATVQIDNTDRSYLVKSVPFVLEFPKQNVRYLKLKASSIKTCPDWHRGFGNPSWIFADEIVVE